jgi:HEAT repeat protein
MRDMIAGLLKKDSNPYVRYRAAFTLAAHGPGKYKGDVLKTLKEAENDDDISDISRKYLAKISHEDSL